MFQASYLDKIEDLKKRLNPEYLDKRLSAEENLWKRMKKKNLLCKYSDIILPFINRITQLSGLYDYGYREHVSIEINYNLINLTNLPQAFDGYRILQISDTHAELNPQLTNIITETISRLDYDLCVHTGDFQDLNNLNCDVAKKEIRKLFNSIKTHTYGVLGNHDSISFISELESNNLTILLNENLAIEHHGEKIYIAGIDDSFIYETHDLDAARKNIPNDAVSILLAHCPNLYAEASACNFDLMLSGHTHGGQICLPGGYPIVNNCKSPLEMISGSWRYKSLHGYTSKGAGSCGVPLRFFCRPEITVHTLKKTV
jgi:uncharacterized protein